MENYRAAHDDMADDASLSSGGFSMSTNFTMSNLPGTGRILDKLYRAGGRKLERLLGGLAQRAGYGPVAVSKRIRQLAWDLSNSSGTGLQSQPTKVQKELSELCRRLLHYAQLRSIFVFSGTLGLIRYLIKQVSVGEYAGVRYRKHRGPSEMGARAV